MKIFFCKRLERNYVNLGYCHNITRLHDAAADLAEKTGKSKESIIFNKISDSKHMEGFVVICSNDSRAEQPLENAFMSNDAWQYFK